jgi:hypothetical protein
VHVLDGLWQGIVGEFAFSLAEGVIGIIFEPAKGVRVDGADGFYVSCIYATIQSQTGSPPVASLLSNALKIDTPLAGRFCSRRGWNTDKTY